MLTVALLSAMVFTLPALPAAWQENANAASSLSEYRVYQNDQPLKEFSKKSEALAYANRYSYSHVEKIADRSWVWDNLPRYKVYQRGSSKPAWEFRSLNEAKQVAQTLTDVHIRDLQDTGWVYASHQRYEVYQGEKTYDGWVYQTVEEAKKAARKWTGAHIIDLETNQWIWDNIKPEDERQSLQKNPNPIYEVWQNDAPAANQPLQPLLRDAIMAASKLSNSVVKNIAKDTIVYTNTPSYAVVKNDKEIGQYYSLSGAVSIAAKHSLSEVKSLKDNAVLWSSLPYYQVYQGEKQIKSFYQLPQAIKYATYYTNSSIQTIDGRKLWRNKMLTYLGWNGSASDATVRAHAANTSGMDMDSPTWFELNSAAGTMVDRSSKKLVQELNAQGISVVPLVHNQFDRKMTTAFLADQTAQATFIQTLINQLVAVGADGLNLDFEEVAGADRSAYTAFVKQLTEAAHAKKLSVSIDLPRGSTSWNHKTAYDHAALGEIVDTIIIMAYDQHWKGSETAGPVAALDWVEQGVQQFLDYGIPRSKLMLGIPFYVREWTIDADGKLLGNRALLMKDLPQLIADTGATGTLDPAYNLYKYTYQKDGNTRVFWAETTETVQQRIALVHKYDLAGAAAWRLGYESASLWEVMLKAK